MHSLLQGQRLVLAAVDTRRRAPPPNITFRLAAPGGGGEGGEGGEGGWGPLRAATPALPNSSAVTLEVECEAAGEVALEVFADGAQVPTAKGGNRLRPSTEL